MFTAAVFIGLYFRFGFTVGYFIYGIFAISLIIAGIIDLRIYILPNIINIAGIAAALIISVVNGLITSSISPVLDFFTGSVACGIPLYIIVVLFKRGMGMGDVKFAILIGSFLGLSSGLCALWISVVLGGVFSVIMIAAKKATRKTLIPFGPFMVIGALAMVFSGEAIKAFLAGVYHV